jgi:hypothetical protein
MTLGLIYLTIHSVVIIVMIIFVIIAGKLFLPKASSLNGEIKEEESTTSKSDLLLVLKKSIKQSLKPLKRMAINIPLTALIVFELNAFGLLTMIPISADVFGLPSCSTACLVGFMTNTIIGLTSVSACFQGGDLTTIEAVQTILYGSLLAMPIFLIRFSGTYFIGVYGLKLGTKIALTSFGIRAFVYVITLAIVYQL